MTLLDIESLARSVLRLGDLRIDVGRLHVADRGEEGKLTPKALAILVELARHPGQTVTRGELLDRVWPESQPTPDALSHAVRELRRALGDDARAPSYIDTVHGLGYRLLHPLVVEEPRAAIETPAAVEATEPALGATVAPAAVHADAPKRRTTALVAGVIAVLAIATFAAWRSTRDAAAPMAANSPAPASRLITSDPGAEEFPKLSPDGATVVFARRSTPDARWDLGVMSIAGDKPMILTHTPDEDELWPVWSADGTRIAYLHLAGEACSIDVMPATGGTARSLADCDRVVFSAIDWSPDGSHLLTSLPSGGPGRELRVHRIPVAGGAPQALQYSADRPGWDRDPVYSPDGKRIAFRRGLPPDYDVFVMSSEGGAAARITRLGTIGEGLTWSPDGNEVIFWSAHEGAPAIYRVDAGTGEIRPSGLVDATRPHVARRQGRLVYQRPWLRVGMLAADTQHAYAQPQPLSESTGSVGFIASSPDHERLAYVSDRAGFEQVWLHELGRAGDRAFGDETLRHITSLDFSDDGGSLLLVVRRGDADHALRLDLDSGLFSELGLVRPLLRDAVGSATPDRLYAIVQGQERPMLARFDRAADGWRETVSEIPATELIRLPGVPGVFGRTPMRSDMVVQVSEELVMREIPLKPRVYGWTATQGTLWYLSSARRASSELRRLDLATGEDAGVREMPHHMPRRRASLGLLGSSIVIAVLVQDDADLGVMELGK